MTARRPYNQALRTIRDSNEFTESKYTLETYGRTAHPTGSGDKATGSGYSFVMRCPTACEGFVGMNWSCGLCKTKVCKECREVNDDKHICNANTVLTVKAMVKEAKPCPKCASMISKIDGCDQMWCTQCHVAFSWRTGKQETVIHNPHFYEWMRRNNREMPAGPVGAAVGPGAGAGECMDPVRVLRSLGIRFYNGNPEFHRMFLLGNYAILLIEVSAELETTFRWRAQRNETEERRRVLRVRRLLKEITDDQWKVALQREEKATKKVRHLADLYTLFIHASADILRPLVDRTTPLEETEYTTIKQQLDDLREYTNKHLLAAKTRFASSVDLIHITI